MRKIQLAMLLLMVNMGAYAQFADSKLAIGGLLNYNSNTFPNSSSIGISPTLALPVGSDALLGVQAGFSTLVTKNDGVDSKNSFHNVSAGVFYQKFYGISENIYFNWQALAGMSLSGSEGAATSSDVKSYDIRFLPGFSWQVMDRLLLHASLGGAGYSHQVQSTDSPGFSDDSRSNRFSVQFNSPQFGFTYLIQ